MKQLKILFFVKGYAPTPEQIKAAEAINGQVCFRNALAVPADEHSIEKCDGVAGEVPEIYAKAYKRFDEAIAEAEQAQQKMSELVGDTKAPVDTKAASTESKTAPALQTWGAQAPASKA